MKCNIRSSQSVVINKPTAMTCILLFDCLALEGDGRRTNYSITSITLGIGCICPALASQGKNLNLIIGFIHGKHSSEMNSDVSGCKPILCA